MFRKIYLFPLYHFQIGSPNMIVIMNKPSMSGYESGPAFTCVTMVVKKNRYEYE
jgi:hypothetical protein